MVIAVDGPAGAGKSTVARKLAVKLAFTYLDTGAMYRALTLKAVETGLDFNNPQALIEMAQRTRVDLKCSGNGSPEVLLDGRDVSFDIRQPKVTKVVSELARIKEVRQILVEKQRELGRMKDSVLDGRDIGTHVFPDAEVKFFIDAAPNERVKRRFLELKGANPGLKMEDVAADLSNRDQIDSTRAFAPLRRAQDAIYIDTTDLGIEEVVEKMAALAVERKVAGNNNG